ncbi:hypothetical protein DMN91_001992 [Ooceraea biroi]|uniref:15-hydroxyprostaglandin dehydrogenase [NAD+] n=1 Tax=Ooceraea biroi TaxID=2015173 RepID=A0A026WK66_OOCBI|nr:15-hydroxyprostaglandin dehydrogenase [NAD(+)] [Ooceraea biroi]EZA55494.1 15-hydroxyprostaglandin dehydrogenase [NAD+] [Ooceraea biroi]RLU25832.1 hypothetical protein DMN91_001992 [Ooceraea biroi]
MDNVQNKIVLITGGATGLGNKFAEILLRNGAKTVAIIDLCTSNGESVAATFENEFGKGRVMFVACDVTKDEDLQKAFKKVISIFQGLDIVINNAGILNDHDWKQTIDINVTAVICSSLLALDHMGKHKGGKGGTIVNIASIFGLSKAGGVPVYCASKHAVVGFSRCLADSYDKTGVRIVTICPGVTTTTLIKNIETKVLDFVDPKLVSQFYSLPVQTVDDATSAILDLIRKGKNGAVWVREGGLPPYAVDFPHYSKRALPIYKSD